ncbi:hypothetical protein KAJ41_00825 [Candidatus Parcubacteria bacterium]|nr:hypothetical protein [Candidatus Parcubacteria bacterium]
MDAITTPLQWEITESQNRKKEKAYLLSKASGFIFILFFIMFSFPIFILLIIIIFAIIYFSKKSSSVFSSENKISHKYKISENGIEIFEALNKKQSTYLWENILSFYAFSEASPVGYLSSLFLGNDFVIVNEQKKQIIIKTNKLNSSFVKMALLKKIQKKASPQNENVFLSISSKKLSLAKNERSNSTTTPSLPQFRDKSPKEKSIAEKNFYDQQRRYKKNSQNQKETFQRNILFFIYILLMFLVTIFYLIRK